MSVAIEWWSSLKHGGLLISPDKVANDFATELSPLPAWRAERLRRALTAFNGENEQLGALLDFVLHDLAELPDGEWQKAQAVEARWSLRSFTGALVKPRRLWQGPNGEVLPVFVPDDGASRQFSGRLGVGRSRQLLSRVVEWLRQKQQPLALVTNGRQWRLVHAGQDYDAWCEWDIDLWFVEGAPGPQVIAWRQLLNRSALVAEAGQRHSVLLNAILASRKGQADLSAVLGERVRQAVEELITASHGAIEQAQQAGKAPAYADLYVAGSRIVMRCIITLFAEARNLLPVDNPVYQRAYSLEGLRQNLDRRATGRGNDRLSQSRSAWPRLMALFRLIHEGSSHEALPVPHYSGALFAPGDAASPNGIDRALALLEGAQNAVTDRQVHRMLQLLTRTVMRVRQGRTTRLVPSPVDFSALSSEYIGILYEGLLDFELKQAAADDPVIFLAVGNEPALTLSQLECMSDAVIKQLFDALKKKDKAGGGEGDEEAGEGDGAEAEDEAETNAAAYDLDEVTEPEEEPTAVAGEDDELALSQDHLQRARAWLEKAAVIAGLVKKPRGRRAAGAAGGDDAEALAKAARSLCARQVAPGQFYLVRWGGTRKGAGTFYTRPQLAAPTVRRALQPLAYEAAQTEVDKRTGLTEVVDWVPKRPEDILALKVCDPAMGSGSFLAGALRYLTDALVASLYHHRLIERAEDGGVPRMADGQISEVLSDELLKLRPTEEGFEDALRAQLKRHIVERCLYGVDLDPLAVELGRMALWVETMDRDLPFGFLDHKLKVGNALVGTWFDTYRDYPALAWEREGGDKDYQKDKPQNLINHFYTDAKGKKRGDKFTAVIAARAKAVPEQLIGQLSGQITLEGGLDASEVHNELLKVFKKLHRLPVHDSDRRATVYREEVLANPHYHSLKARMDLWCALWFWPGEHIELAPLPLQFAQPDAAALAVVAEVAAKRRFFHWELEFPDVFTSSQKGFDAVLGNPPWETMQPNSKEYFSNQDPLYRAYGKQEALTKQVEYFRARPQLELDWIDFMAGFKAFANWMNFAGAPFGDRIVEDKDGKKKHQLNLGGRGRNSFEASVAMHKKWRQQRKQRVGLADSAHPFVYQGAGKPYLQKMFLELSHSLLRSHGRLGMIVPSGIYTDKGTTELRTLFLDFCDWQWLFAFENREGIFDIHRSFKFCPLVIQKTGTTQAIRAAFMHRNVDDWAQAERHVLAYPRERVMEFSPYSKAILEIRSEQDLRVLQKNYASGVLLGDKSERGWGVKYQQGDFNMTSDSKLFSPLTKWEALGYQSDEYGHWLKGPWQAYGGPVNILDRPAGLVLSRDGRQALQVDCIEDVALPLYQGGMINIYDKCASGYIPKVSAQANWQPLEFGSKRLLPQFLVGRQTCLERGDRYKPGLKLSFRDITRNTDTRTAIGSLVIGAPCGNTLGVISGETQDVAAVGFAFSTIAFDWLVRKRLGGTHLNLFVAEECAIAEAARGALADYVGALLGLTFPDEMSAPVWMALAAYGRRDFSWRRQWAITPHERTRLKAILEALAFHYAGLDRAQARLILRDADRPSAQLTSDVFCKTLEQRGMWRIDKHQPPELRHPVLALIAFDDLKAKGLNAFLHQNDGEGWMLPGELCLADFELGYDDRAKYAQPVASVLGERFLPSQLGEDVARSWDECAAHAELIQLIVPEVVERDVNDGNADTGREEPANVQGGLF